MSSNTFKRKRKKKRKNENRSTIGTPVASHCDCLACYE